MLVQPLQSSSITRTLWCGRQCPLSRCAPYLARCARPFSLPLVALCFSSALLPAPTWTYARAGSGSSTSTDSTALTQRLLLPQSAATRPRYVGRAQSAPCCLSARRPYPLVTGTRGNRKERVRDVARERHKMSTLVWRVSVPKRTLPMAVADLFCIRPHLPQLIAT
ncbi:hypothetical protein EDC04DRAFT_2683983 [Pisolithus marmoratus]|nr:hypothetical protein EDC04DRAFT_2683983 [Pisolithus marmoratus]